VALGVLMRAPPERRAELHAQALKRSAQSGENDRRRRLLAECVEAYSDLDEAQLEQLRTVFTTTDYQEARALMVTTYERGKIERMREMVLLQLEAKFSPLPAGIQERVAAMSAELLQRLLIDLVRAHSLQELHLTD
jgi:alpha-ketoglutarate-dependent taurine dioxygenase